MAWSTASMAVRMEEAERRIQEALRTESIVLDLGDLGLSQLPESLASLSKLQQLFLGRRRPHGEMLIWDKERPAASFARLGPVASLQDLRRIFLGPSTLEGFDLEKLAPLPHLTHVWLENCNRLGECLGQLADLSPLRSLYLQSNTELKGDLEQLGRLTRLGDLRIYDCFKLSGDLSFLRSLEDLRVFHLGHATGVGGSLEPLRACLNLEELLLFGLSMTGDLCPLSPLSKLKQIEIISMTELAGSLASLGRISAIQSLNLLIIPKLEWDLESLTRLPNLRSPCVSPMWFTPLRLDSLASHSKLENLEIRNTSEQVVDLALINEMPQLSSLRIVGCKIAQTAKLRSDGQLLRLELTGIPNLDLPLVQYLLQTNAKLEEFQCDNIQGIPKEVLSRFHPENCLHRLRSYLAEVATSAVSETDLKIILLGNGRVGKTQFCRRLRGEAFESDSPTTHGIQLWRQQMELGKPGSILDCTINWWDFGGQDIYHSTHSLFLRSRAIFVILWTPQLENSAEFDEGGSPQRNHPLAYWLDYVRSVAGAKCPIIVVQSKCEDQSEEQVAPTHLSGFPFARSCHYGASNDYGLEILCAHLRNAARYLIGNSGPLLIGQGRAEVRRRLYDMRQQDQLQAEPKRAHRTLQYSEFVSICQEVGSIASPQDALDYFHQTGVVFYQPGLFNGLIVLDQSWALDAIYSIFRIARTSPLILENGRFTRRDLELLSWTDKPHREQELLLGLMRACEICFVYREAVEDIEAIYLAPDLLPAFEKVQPRLWAWENGASQAPLLRLEYRFLHRALLRSLIYALGISHKDHAEFWKFGLWLRTVNGSQLFLKHEDTASTHSPGAGVLLISAQGSDWYHLIRKARKTALEHSSYEKPSEQLQLNGHWVERIALDHVIDGKVRAINGTGVAAKPFLDFWNETTDWQSMESVTEKAPLLAPAQGPDVYLSYAWGDNSPEGQQRAEVVDRLSDSLRRDGFVVRRDSFALGSGELISQFIDELVKSRVVVAIISEKYLRSAYCMYEIYKIYQACQADPEQLARRVIPIVLPGLQFRNLKERAPYIKFWSEEQRSLEELLKDPDIRPSSQSYEEYRLVRDFANHIDAILNFIQNLFMSRNLEAHFSGDFAEIRQAIRKLTGVAIPDRQESGR